MCESLNSLPSGDGLFGLEKLVMNGCPALLQAVDFALLRGLQRLHINGSGLGWWETALPPNFAKLSTLRTLSELALSNYPLCEAHRGPRAPPESKGDALRYIWPCTSLRHLTVRDAGGVVLKASVTSMTQLQVVGLGGAHADPSTLPCTHVHPARTLAATSTNPIQQA